MGEFLYRKLLFPLLCIVLIQYVIPGTAIGQPNATQVEYYSINDGLSDRLVTSLMQSQYGLLWIGTPNGLNKFDGYEFTHFNDTPLNPYPISHSNIKSVSEKDDGKLVILYQNKLGYFDIFDPVTFENEQIQLGLENGIEGIVRKIYVSKKGKVFVLCLHETSLKLYQFISESSFKEIFQVDESNTKLSAAVDIVQLNTEQFFINDSEKGLQLISPSGKVLKQFTSESFNSFEKPNLYPGSAYFLHEDAQGHLWFALSNLPGVFIYNPEIRTFELFDKIPTDKLYSNIWEDSKGNLLIAQSNGIGTYPQIEKMYCITPDKGVLDFSYLLEISNLITCVSSKDFFETIFFGIDTGLKIVQNNRTKVQTFLSQKLKSGIRGTVLRGIEEDEKGGIYFMREISNIYYLQPETDLVDTIQLIDRATGKDIDFNCGIDIHLDKQKYLWAVGCKNSNFGQIIKYNIETCNAQTYPFEDQFSAFAYGPDGRLWLGSYSDNESGNLVYFDPSDGTYTIYTDEEGKNPFQETILRFLYFGSDQQLWVGTDNGLFRMDPHTWIAQKIEVELSSPTIYTIHEASDSSLWLGTRNGLNIYHPKTEELKVLDTKDGLPSNTLCGILPDEKENFWISTYNGLAYYDRQSNLFRNFFQVDGFSDDEFNRFSYHTAQNGRYFFGGVNGLNAFYPEDLLASDSTPPVVLTKITRFNKSMDSIIIQENNLNTVDNLIISPYDTYFQINFTLPNYVRPQRNQYSSWLEGYESDWIYLGNRPIIRYNSLPPGSYTLHLRGADQNGIWSSEVRSIKIKVQQIFYKTRWFFFLCIIAIAALVFGMFQYQLEQKLKVERLRMKLSSDLHDEVSGLLSGIAMQTDVLQMLASDDKSKSRLQTIGEVSRKAMSKMSDVIWSIDSRKDRVEDLLNRMQEHADDILLPMDIKYDFEVNKIESNQKMPFNIRQDLYFIYKEAINNVAKHSNASKVFIRLGNNGANFELSVKDNGNGVAINGQKNGRLKISHKSGQGLSNIQMRAQRINASLNISQNGGYAIHLKMKKFT